MPSIPRRAQCEGSSTFSPDAYFSAWSKEEYGPPYDNDFRKFIVRTFGLKPNDDYGYMAQHAEVTLLQAQTYVEFGGQGGLHGWYWEKEKRDQDGEEGRKKGVLRTPPNATDIAAYTDVFRPATSTSKALIALGANAKRESIRADVGRHLQANYQPPAAETKIVVNKSKTHVNPYFDVWAWSNQILEWAGPEDGTEKIKHSHAILPVLYHHFGCVCPSYESLEVIRQVAQGRKVVDMGSGNGYWTYMLRRMEPPSKKEKKVEVVPVDSGMSEWRTMWVGDTVQADGEKWLRQDQGAPEAVLLLVYPTVGNEFTSKMIRAYSGTTIVSAGSQNASGFTAFAKETIAEWMAREMPEWNKVLQIPLPSFAGKDEALFVFEKGECTGKGGQRQS